MKLFVGIDIGKNGGVAIIDHHGGVVFTSTVPKISKEIDIKRFFDTIGYASNFDVKKEDIKVVMENVHSIFGAGAKSNHEFGRVNGYVEMAIVAHGFSYVKANPKDWQRVCWEGVSPVMINTGKKDKKGDVRYKCDTKATSLLAAKRLFPHIDMTATDSERSKKPHDGIVDAILLAYYSYLKFK